MRTCVLTPWVAVLIGLAACDIHSGGAADLSLPDADCQADPSSVQCGERCLVDEHCRDPARPRCEPNTHKCVACLIPPARDNCPSGQVCTIQNGEFLCTSRCNGIADCVKLAGDNYDCCGGLCAPTDRDVANCGGCGVTCDPPNNADAACYSGHCIIGICHAGYDDCNKSIDDGCEVATGTDPNNCGGCGKVCKPFPNGIPMCADSVCSAVCAPGYAHCSARPEDGCEVDTTGDAANCGACGKICTAPANATAACDASKCGFRCKPGFADCNGDPKDGCEVSTQGDVNNCGHCGNTCPLRPQSQSATCTGGQCGNSCNNGFGDCDGNPANGCEADLNSDLGNCGSCGAGCLNNHAKATCGLGVCNLVCDKGFTDCDMDGKDGCEANVLTDPRNCGGCGMPCPQNLNGCSAGKCVAAYLPVGPQNNVGVGQLTGWTQCYMDTYGSFQGDLAQIQAGCAGGNIMTSCRPNNSQTIDLLAWAPRDDVFFVTNLTNNCNANRQLHNANGTDWYYDTSWGWGFTAPNDGNFVCSCDADGGGKAPDLHPDQRLCWHTGGGTLSSGYRCGKQFPGGNYDRIVWTY